MAHASTSRLARSPTPDLHDTTDDVLPLAFDSEAELLGVLGRLRDGLQQRTRKAWEDDGRKGSCTAVEEIVLKQFFDVLAPHVSANCTIAGLPYAKHQLREHPSEITEPFSDELHERVVMYQDALFVAREQNVEQRRELPSQMVEIVQKRLEQDKERVEALEKLRPGSFPERVKAPLPAAGKGRKSLSKGAPPPDSLSALEREQYFAEAKAELDGMLINVPVLSTEADSAVRVAADARRVVGA